MHIRFYIIIKYFSRNSMKYTTTSLILGSGPTFAVLTMSSILQIIFQTDNRLHDYVLESVPSAKYLGVTISEDLRWTDHINNISKKASQTLGYMKRNIRVHNREYASTVWSPDTGSDSYKLESVQRRAARWVTRDYRYTSSVSAMLQDLNWRTLDQRCTDSRMVLLCKVTYDLVAIPAADYLVRNTRPSTRTFSCIQTDLDSERLLQVHILSPHYHPLECPTSPHTCPPCPGTV